MQTVQVTHVFSLLTSTAGFLWISVKLYYGVRRLRREDMLEDSKAMLEAAKAEAEAARLLNGSRPNGATRWEKP